MASNTVKTTLITVVGSIVVAMVTTLGTIYINTTGIRANTAALDTLNAKTDAVKKLGVPVGTIVASSLTPREFAKASGDPDNLEVTKSRWTLADGKSVAGTTYATIRGEIPIPNLCGVFLRGKANKRAGIDEIALDEYRPDTVGYHQHSAQVANPGVIAGGGIVYGGSTRTEGTTALIAAWPGPETVPKNVTVNYYIKINDF